MICQMIMITPHESQGEPITLAVIGIVVGLAGIASDIYHSSDDDLGEAASRKIEEVIQRQLKEGLSPLRELDPKLKELLGSQGRLELGVEQLKVQIDQWGHKLIEGQGELKSLLAGYAKENRGSHLKTQGLIKGLQSASFRTGLILLQDGVSLLETDQASGKLEIASAKSKLRETLEYLKEREGLGELISTEQRALLHLSLSTCYLAQGLEKRALREIRYLMELPSQGEGLLRFISALKDRIPPAKIQAFDSGDQKDRDFAKGLVFALDGLKSWLWSVEPERSRLGQMKSKAMSEVMKSERLKKIWIEVHQDSASKEAQSREDELALQAFAVFTGRYHDHKSNELAEKIGIDWVQIEGGSFMMGGAGKYDGKPIHKVTLKSFQMSKTEVTVGQYRKCVTAKACSAPNTGESCNWDKSGREEHPINCVTWFQLNEFAKWVGGRLPTEAEWEYAARSRGKKRTYPWGDQEPSCQYTVMSDGGRGCGKDRTWAVCSKRRGNTKQGLCDMGGNVWEWVQDEYKKSYNGAPTNGTARCTASDCSKPPSNANRVLRGGGWYFGYARYFRAAVRFNYRPAKHFYAYGGRVARSP